MTQYKANIKFGDTYTDGPTGLSGRATIVCFNENGCIEVVLERLAGEDIKQPQFNVLRLDTSGGVPEEQVFETDIVLGKKYRATDTGLEGHAAVIEFHEHIATRVLLKSVGETKDGIKKLTYHAIDDFLLEEIDAKGKVVTPPAERKSDKPSPPTMEVELRRS